MDMEYETEHAWQSGKRKEKLDFSSFSRFGGDSWTRTNDPIDVNDVLSVLVMFATKTQDLVV